jgi:hypothetical protein
MVLFSLDAFAVFASAEITKPIEESAKTNPSTLFIVFPLLTKTKSGYLRAVGESPTNA